MTIRQPKIAKMQYAIEGSTDYNMAINSPPPNRDAILKSNHNKRELSRGLSLLNLGPDVTMDSRDYGAFTHDEADVTMVPYMLINLHHLVR